jgi:hypothetical protein
MNNKQELIFLSTIHYDPKGESRIKVMLDRLNPEIVTVEDSEQKLIYLQSEEARAIHFKVKEILKRRGATDWQLKIFDEFNETCIKPFESKAVRKYCEDRIPYYLIDLWDETERNLYQEMSISDAETFCIPTLERLTKEKSQIDADFEYNGVRRSYSYDISVPLDDPDVGRRDDYMESQLREIITQNQGKRIIHIGGTKHSFPAIRGRSLYSKLIDYKPTRHLLIEAEETDN